MHILLFIGIQTSWSTNSGSQTSQFEKTPRDSWSTSRDCQR